MQKKQKSHNVHCFPTVQCMVSEISGADIAKTGSFQLLNQCSDERMLDECTPPKSEVSYAILLGFGVKQAENGLQSRSSENGKTAVRHYDCHG